MRPRGISYAKLTQFAMVLTLNPVTSIPHPEGEIVSVLAAEMKLVIVSARGVDMSDIGVMHHLASQKRRAARATIGGGGIVVDELGTLRLDFTLKHRLVVHRAQSPVLIVGHNQDDVGWLLGEVMSQSQGCEAQGER